MWRGIQPLARTSLCAAVLLLAAVASAATRVDPALRFRTVRTAHFVIHFHQGEDAVAARLAVLAEDAWAALRETFGLEPPDQTHVVLADQTDVSNGWATPLPYNTILIAASWPTGSESIGHADDWVRLVLTHELTHIVHLDRSRGYARAVRSIFGRAPLAFPNLFQPTWEVEGLATYFESVVTGYGRLHAPDFRAIEWEQARVGSEVDLSRVNGGLIAWPGGTAPYAHGLGFTAYLAGTYGRERFARLAERTARRVPYTGSGAYRPVFGKPLGTLWDEYQADLRARTLAPADVAGRATRLTTEGFVTVGPRIAPAACAQCGTEVIYSVRTPHEFPALKAVPLSGGRPRTLARRYLGTTAAVTPSAIVFDQQDLHRNVGLYSDLYTLDRGTGRVRRLTTERRLRDPDLSPDGRRLAAVHESRGSRALVVADVEASGALRDIRVLLSGPEVQYATPRWSPDGTRLAVERHVPGRSSEIVVVTVETRAEAVIAQGATRATTPAWRPDGRAVIAAADVPGEPFNLFEFPIDAGADVRRLTAHPGGATWPAVTADGRLLVFVGYTTEGFDLFVQRYEPVPQDARPAPAADVAPPGPVASLSAPAGAPGPAASPAPPYSPWTTLAPRAWSPVVFSDGDQVQVGASATGVDVLGYHVVSGVALWRASSPRVIGRPTGARPDWSLAYTYDRWQPRWFGSVSSSTSFFRGASAEGGASATLREDTVEAGVLIPRRRVRRAERLFLSGQRATNRLLQADGERRYTRVAARAGWSLSTAQRYGYSIGPVDGLTAAVTGELAGDAVSRLSDAATVTADLRAYLPGIRRHQVLALRGAAGLSNGSRDAGRTFQLGGAAGNPDPLDFGRGAMSLLRGFGLDAFAGRRVALINAEYRVPFARIERGAGTWPVFLRTLHGAAFVDAGHAWNDRFRLGDLKSSIGGEFAMDLVLGYALPITVSAGVARGRDGAGGRPPRTTVYARIGRAF
ncbi:MAG: hypothetical protein AB7I13_02965 [Vicinamibacterales bacterium]